MANMMHILSLVIFAVLSSGCRANQDWKPKTSEEIRVIRNECLKENPLTDELILSMKHMEFPDEEPVRQYVLCTALKMDVFCVHEGYHADRLAKQFKMDLPESEVLSIAQGCIDSNEQKSTADVWAFHGHNCMMESKVGERVREYIKRKHEEAVAQAAAAASKN